VYHPFRASGGSNSTTQKPDAPLASFRCAQASPSPSARYSVDEAQGLYQLFLVKTKDGHAGNDDLRKDFAALRRTGHSTPAMQDIEGVDTASFLKKRSKTLFFVVGVDSQT
jgi:hypothetical protein